LPFFTIEVVAENPYTQQPTVFECTYVLALDLSWVAGWLWTLPKAEGKGQRFSA
jgi:hypothetical protein